MTASLPTRIALLGLCATALLAGAAEVLLQVPLEPAEPPAWRHKDNCRLEARRDERGAVLHWRSRFTGFNFGWATYFAPSRLDLTRAGRVTCRIRGDGSGHRLHLQLGRLETGKPTVYYANRADAIRLDTTDWQEVTFHLARFATPGGRDPAADLREVAFIQLFISQEGDGTDAALEIADLRVIEATEEELAMLEKQRAALSLDLQKEPPHDGTNLLPNPDFEVNADGDACPDGWTLNGPRERFDLDSTIAHGPGQSLRITSSSDGGKANLALGRRLGQGHWVVEAWYRTAGSPAVPRQAVSISLRMTDEAGVPVHSLTAWGEATDGAWRLLRQAFRTRPEAARLSLVFGAIDGTGQVWWDDLALRFDTAAAAAAAAAERRGAELAAAAAAAIDALAARVEALPADTPAAALKRAALDWGLEDARAAIAAGLGDEAQASLDDITARLDQPAGQRREPPEGYLPAVADIASNPYATSVMEAARGHAADRRTYAKGLEGHRQFKSGWEFRALGDRIAAATWAFCQKDSPLAGDPALLRFILRGLQAEFENHLDGDLNPYRLLSHGYHDPNINRFAYCPTLEAWLWLRTTYPDLILPSKDAAWAASARTVLDFQRRTYGDGKVGPADMRYPNMDVTYMLMMALGGELFNDDSLRQEARRFLTGIADCVYPDGAFTYCDYQNECFVYHQINVASVARYAQLTGEALAREVIVRSRPYYPLVVEPSGITEDYTDCFWKHYWTRLAAPEGPEIVAGMTGCRLNKRIANQALTRSRPGGQFAAYAAMAYRDFPDEPLPDRYVVYDRNTEGPRGRYGAFSFAATGRDLGPGYQGKDTFAGAMIADEPGAANPLNAALQVVTNEVRVAPDGLRWKTCRYLSQDERNSSTIAADLAAFTTRYRIQNVAWGGGSTLTDWAGSQQWLLSPHRLVGLLEIEALADTEAYAIHGRVRFGCGRGRGVEPKEVERRDDNFFKYGMMLCRLHEHTYADVITEPSETFYIDPPESFSSREIVLRDIAGDAARSRRAIPRGQRHYVVVEVFPGWSEPARSVRRLATAEGLRGLALDAAEGSMVLLHNPTETALDWQVTPDWTGRRVERHHDGTPEPRSEVVTLGPTLRLAPHRHVVLTLPDAAP